MSEVTIHIKKEETLARFLSLNNFDVEDLGNGLLRVVREDELPVYVNHTDNHLYFEVDLGNVSAIGSQELYFKLLDLNTEILPVSFGIDKTNTDDPRLVLVESRETTDLSDNELLSVFDALELAADKAEAFKDKVMEFLPKGKIPTLDITPVIGAHIGPGAMGYALVKGRMEK